MQFRRKIHTGLLLIILYVTATACYVFAQDVPATAAGARTVVDTQEPPLPSPPKYTDASNLPVMTPPLPPPPTGNKRAKGEISEPRAHSRGPAASVSIKPPPKPGHSPNVVHIKSPGRDAAPALRKISTKQSPKAAVGRANIAPQTLTVRPRTKRDKMSLQSRHIERRPHASSEQHPTKTIKKSGHKTKSIVISKEGVGSAKNKQTKSLSEQSVLEQRRPPSKKNRIN
jgi:hypothetical protein